MNFRYFFNAKVFIYISTYMYMTSETWLMIIYILSTYVVCTQRLNNNMYTLAWTDLSQQFQHYKFLNQHSNLEWKFRQQKHLSKGKFIAGYTRTHSLPSKILPFRNKTITKKLGTETMRSFNQNCNLQYAKGQILWV